MEDCDSCALPPGLWDCPADWSGGSAVAGTTAFGLFDGQTAFFGWNGLGDTSWSELRLFVYDISVDLDAAKANPNSEVPFSLQLSPGWNQPEWVNQGIVDGKFVQNDETSEHKVLLEVTGTAGNWQHFDPKDPPRLLGMVHPTDPDAPKLVEGPFDAVFCDNFVEQIHPE